MSELTAKLQVSPGDFVIIDHTEAAILRDALALAVTPRPFIGER